ncbi:MAG: tyrosine-type recombinase/integrase [Bacillota bacterium]|nr:tyrosine-type recombinase/integrase [Bacillota bacterium]
MSTPNMLDAVNEYLASRRRLGYQLYIEGGELHRFAEYADGLGHQGAITIELAVRWAKLPTHGSPLYWARRLDMVRRLAGHQRMSQPETEIPPRGLLGPSYRRMPPHIYSHDEIEALLQEASRLGPRGGLRPHTYRTLFGLLACTGLRISEALRLTSAYVDLREGRLTVVATKFHKSRLLPLHATAIEMLDSYARHRQLYLPRTTSTSFFLTERGTRLKYHKTILTFIDLRKRLGWSERARPPRIHDLRHTFAVRTLLRWYEEGQPIGNKVASLATYLGHVKVSDTYWYLSAVPELLAAASSRFEVCCLDSAEREGAHGYETSHSSFR